MGRHNVLGLLKNLKRILAYQLSSFSALLINFKFYKVTKSIYVLLNICINIYLRSALMFADSIHASSPSMPIRAKAHLRFVSCDM